MIDKQAGSATRTTLFVILGASVFLILAFMLLPKGFSDDLSKMGQGKAAVVLIHDKGSVRSLDLMTLLNKVRSDYSGKVEFFVVDIATREGRMFRQQQNDDSIVLVLFSANGAKLAAHSYGLGEAGLRSELDKLSSEKS